jgi:hypothetical protein
VLAQRLGFVFWAARLAESGVETIKRGASKITYCEREIFAR